MNEEFTKKLDEKIVELEKMPEAVVETEKRKRGRPKGSTKTVEEKPVVAEKPLPPVNENEALIFAQMFCGIANNFVKKEHREKLNFSVEEMLSVTRPAVQLKDFYLPNFGGIYAVWAQFAIAGGGLAINKWNIAKELVENGRKKDNSHIRDTGNGEVNESARVIENATESNNL